MSEQQTHTAIAYNLRSLRYELNMTKGEFSQLLGFSQSCYSSYETGIFKLTNAKIKTISSSLGINDFFLCTKWGKEDVQNVVQLVMGKTEQSDNLKNEQSVIFRVNMNDIRQNFDVYVREFASLLNINEELYLKWENGQCSPSLSTVRAIALKLNVKFHMLANRLLSKTEIRHIIKSFDSTSQYIKDLYIDENFVFNANEINSNLIENMGLKTTKNESADNSIKDTKDTLDIKPTNSLQKQQKEQLKHTDSTDRNAVKSRSRCLYGLNPIEKLKYFKMLSFLKKKKIVKSGGRSYVKV